MEPVVLKVIVRNVTGRVRYYPTGENSQPVFELIRKKTLSELELEALKTLGVRIERLQDNAGR